MRSLLLLSTLTATLLATAGVQAQPRPATLGKEIPDVKVNWSREGDSEDEEYYLFRSLRGGIALFYYWRSTSLDSIERLSEMEALHREYANQGVRFISVTADNEDRMNEVLEERESAFFRYIFRGLGPYYHLGAFSDPYVVLVDPRSRLAWRGVPDNHFRERLDDLIEYTKPPLGDEQWLGRRLRQAERFFDQREFGRAYTIAQELFRMTDDAHAMHGRAEALRARCEEAAREWLREAVQAERDGDNDKAAYIVAEIAVRFRDPDEDEDDDSDRGSSRDEDDENVQRRAEFEIGRMSGDRKLKATIREQVEEAEGRLLNDRAEGFEQDEYYVDAKYIYEQVIEEHEDTDAAKEAKKRLRRIRRDDEIQRKIAERRAAEEAIRWLDTADRYAGAELYAEARDKYEALIKKHPDTTAARRAKQRLADLPEPDEAAADSKRPETARKP
jgi:hypothetical protein